MERASCSDSCPGLFSQLKEVYLFGCNTLNAEAIKSMSSEVGRSLVRAGTRRPMRSVWRAHWISATAKAAAIACAAFS